MKRSLTQRTYLHAGIQRTKLLIYHYCTGTKHPTIVSACSNIVIDQLYNYIHPKFLKMMRNLVFTLMFIIISVGYVACVKPEITHKFKEPENRPPFVITSIFTLLVASPIFILLSFWPKKIYLRECRLVFQLALACILLTYARFWFGTNMFTTLKYAIPLTGVLYYSF